jgi:hypothetical protein
MQCGLVLCFEEELSTWKKILPQRHKGFFNVFLCVLCAFVVNKNKHSMTNESSKLKQAAELISAKRKNASKYLNLFLFFHSKHNAHSLSLINEMTKAVSKEFECAVDEVSIQELSPNHSNYSPSEVIQCIRVDSRRIEGFRDVLKSVLWKRHRSHLKPRRIAETLTTQDNTAVTSFRLSDYGLFVPYTAKRRRTIRVHSFPHEPFYRYRLCTNKTDTLPPQLREYLYLIFEDCPNHLYKANGFRASQQYFKIDTQLHHTRKHEIIELTKQSKDFTKFKSRHENVEKYFLINDPKSIACEIPVWVEPAELSDYRNVFHTDNPLTGHIDLVRYEDHKIAVWDYKPKASKEVTATTQVFLYALMLSVRTGISLNHFICGYFDEKDLYMFNPYEAKFIV